MDDQRPNPDALLDAIKSNDRKTGKLRIFFGYAAGVGKTYSMLDEARRQYENGVDLLVGYIEPHTRPETMQLMEGLPLLPPLAVPYKNISLKEFDLDAALARKPELILVDELAHTNPPGMRNKKRYQDVEELMKAGIDVYTTLNVQHMESLNDVVQDITGVYVRETVPDYIFDYADVKLVDIGPDELLKRFADGKIYSPERAAAAMKRFFTTDNLRALREVSMRKTADRIGHDTPVSAGSATRQPGTKLLVCISSAPSAAKCILWTARMAEALHAPWTVLHVETSDTKYVGEAHKQTLHGHLEMAERLGGEIVTLYGEDSAAAVAEYAAMAGITDIVIGIKKKSILDFFRGDFADRLIGMLGNIEIHIISGGSPMPEAAGKKQRAPGRVVSFSWRDTLITAAALALATVVSTVLRHLGIGDQSAILVYILSVVIVSRVTTGYMYGALASLLSVLLFNFFFTEPRFTFNVIRPDHPVTFAIMLAVALITSALTGRVKEQAKSAVEREHRTEVMYEINRKLLITHGVRAIAELVNGYISNIFERPAVLYTGNPAEELPVSSGTEPILLSPNERAVAHWVFMNGKHAGSGTGTLAGAVGYYMPFIAQGRVLGVMGLAGGGAGWPEHKDRVFLQIAGSLAAMALERQRLSDEQRQASVDAEKEKIRGDLLRAVSHDLRTPLTGIVGASSAILDTGDRLDKKEMKTLVAGIKEDSQWLLHMVENLLSVTRTGGGQFSVHKTVEAAEEVVAEAVSRIKSRFPGLNMKTRVPREPLMVPMDGTLIAQVLINLLDNAARHSGSGAEIRLAVKEENDSAVFEVFDNGGGIEEADLPHLFEGRSADSVRGAGLGLSICMSIVKAHGGNMEAMNNPGGGALFRFILPLENTP